MEKYGYTNIGPRKTNEDYFSFEELGNNGIFCVADGVGGNNCGEYASKFCVDLFIEEVNKSNYNPGKLTQNLHDVNSQLIKEASSKSECYGMATTFIGLVILEDYAHIIHTGDSRLYQLRKNGLKQLTEDHTEAKRLRNEGLLTFEASLTYPRKHLLDSALGMDGEIIVEYTKVKHEPSDRFILATDGCYDVFTKVEIRDISIANPDFKDFCDMLKNNIENRKLKDNATFVAIEI